MPSCDDRALRCRDRVIVEIELDLRACPSAYGRVALGEREKEKKKKRETTGWKPVAVLTHRGKRKKKKKLVEEIRRHRHCRRRWGVARACGVNRVGEQMWTTAVLPWAACLDCLDVVGGGGWGGGGVGGWGGGGGAILGQSGLDVVLPHQSEASARHLVRREVTMRSGIAGVQRSGLELAGFRMSATFPSRAGVDPFRDRPISVSPHGGSFLSSGCRRGG